MEERETLRLTFELPAQALDQATRLVEAVRLLLEAGQARDLPPQRQMERGESAGFDEERFRALAAEDGETFSSAPLPPAAEAAPPAEIAAASGPAETPGEAVPAEPVPPELSGRMAEVLAAPTAGEAVSPGPAEAEAAGYDAEAQGDPEAVRPPEMERAEVPGALSEDLNPPPEPPSVQAGDMVPIPDAPTAQPEAEQNLEDLPTAEVTVRYEASPPPGTVQAGVTPVAEQIPGSLRRGGQGEISSSISPRPAPLTAEAVNLAFRRDDRRYDNGFPLY